MSNKLILYKTPTGVERTSDVRAVLLSWMASDIKNGLSEGQMVSSKDIVNHVTIAKTYIR